MSIGMVITKGPGVWLGAMIASVETKNHWFSDNGWVADELEYSEPISVAGLVHVGCTVEFFPCGRLEGTGA